VRSMTVRRARWRRGLTVLAAVATLFGVGAVAYAADAASTAGDGSAATPRSWPGTSIVPDPKAPAKAALSVRQTAARLASLVLNGADDGRIMDQLGLTRTSVAGPAKRSAAGQAGIRMLSQNKDVDVNVPSVYTLPGTGDLLYAVSRFVWQSSNLWVIDITEPDLVAMGAHKMGDLDGFAIRFSQPVLMYGGASVALKASPWIPVGNPDDNVPSGTHYPDWSTTTNWSNDVNFRAFRFQDETYAQACPGHPSSWCFQYNAHTGAMVVPFKRLAGDTSCLQMVAEYAHSYGEDGITGFDVSAGAGGGGVGFQWENNVRQVDVATDGGMLGCGDPIEDKYYNELNGARGVLGEQITGVRPTRDHNGTFALFEGGAIYWSPSTGAHAVWGYMYPKWKQYDLELGPLGYPTTDVKVAPDNVGQYIHFQRGSIYWSPSTGTHSVWGLIKDKWAEKGRETGPLGYPTSDELDTQRRDGRYNTFQHGSIYFSTATGAHAVWGLIFDKWANLHYELGALGFPTTDEMSNTTDHRGVYNHFQNGSIYYTAGTGAHGVWGYMVQKWQEKGREGGPLGYPTTEVMPAPDGVGQYSHFERGSIYWSPASGVHSVWGLIKDKWHQMGRETGVLGYPKTDETPTPNGRGVYNHFQGGGIYYSGQTGTHDVLFGCVWNQWAAAGWEGGRYGFPIGDTSLSGGDGEPLMVYNDFEHGRISCPANS
jgi:uncharacterized protein with LGFP repeats